MIDWSLLATNLADQLHRGGHVQCPAWRKAFAATPRHVFVPRFYALDEFNQPRSLVDGTDPAQHKQWLDAIYQDQVLVTRYEVVDGTMPDGREIRIASSSASMPQVVAQMLQALQVRDGHRVLEIGTGTGYNAALLCTRLGDHLVASVELDEAAAFEAADNLAAAGYHPSLAIGDGADGHPDGAPYDRIIATCAISHVPQAWISQLAPDGLLVAPLTFGSGLAVLSKTNPEEVSGRLDANTVGFMPLRAPGHDQQRPDLLPEPATTHHTTTAVELDVWASEEWRLWLALNLPNTRYAENIDDNGSRTGIIAYTGTNRATVDYTSGGEGPWLVAQDDARVWDAVDAAWRSWQDNARPDRTRLGITAHTGGEQYVWLDEPNGNLRWPISRPASAAMAE